MLVGLTGGIGSGKTVVSNFFSELGVPIVDTDIIAREVVAPNSPTLKQLTDTFGKQIIDEQGKLDRDVLREIAFDNDDSKQKLDEITHPAIRQQTFEQIDQADYAYCIVVVPLLIETDFKDFVDRILVVTANKQDRVNWIKKRSALSEEEINDIMQAQTQDEIRLKFADDIIQNTSTLEALKDQVETLHQKYLELAQISISQ